jgi:hypothetical protein
MITLILETLAVAAAGGVAGALGIFLARLLFYGLWWRR